MTSMLVLSAVYWAVALLLLYLLWRRGGPLREVVTDAASRAVARPVWDAVALAAGKRDRSLVLAISTPGPAREWVMWYLVEHRRRGDDPSFVLVGYAAPEGCDVADETPGTPPTRRSATFYTSTR